MLKMINYVILIIEHNENPANRIFNLWTHKYTEQIKACHSLWNLKICGLCVFLNLFCPDFNKSGGEGLIISNGWLLDEVNVALIKKDRKQSESFAALLLQKYLFQRCNLTVLWCQKMQQQKILLQWFCCCCCSAGWMRHCKMRQEETEATVAGFQDHPGWERKKSTGADACCCGWSCCFHQGRRGSFEGLTMPH